MVMLPQLSLIPHTQLLNNHLLGKTIICMELSMVGRETEGAIQNGVLNKTSIRMTKKISIKE